MSLCVRLFQFSCVNFVQYDTWGTVNEEVVDSALGKVKEQLLKLDLIL